MPGITEFRHVVESEILAVGGSGIDRLKCLIEFLNIARLSIAEKSVEIVLAFFILGKVEEGEFRTHGQVVLPCCRNAGPGGVGRVKSA